LEEGKLPPGWAEEYRRLLEQAEAEWLAKPLWPRTMVAAMHYALLYLELRYRSWRCHGTGGHRNEDTERELALVTGPTRISFARSFGQAMTYMNTSGENRQSLIDRFTGLLNRRGFQQRLVAEYDRAKRLHLPLSVLALDLDRFREVNRRYLLPGGDQVLAEFARLVACAARPGDLVVRDGGDQFSVILPDTGREAAYREADRLRRVIESATMHVRGEPVTVTASVGVATATFEEAEAWELFVRARNAVHQAKDSGRNRVELA
jgi:diguanylate cyclase